VNVHGYMVTVVRFDIAHDVSGTDYTSVLGDSSIKISLCLKKCEVINFWYTNNKLFISYNVTL
jgi:hypothetical protein